jgi:2,3-bisphosphoglycerate-independent phosphoglycerate mutase
MAPDDAAHTKDPVAKKNVIEALDRGIGRSVGPLLSDPSTLIVITSDHSTPSCGRSVHSGEAVPLVFVSEWARKDQVMTFDEVACSQGALGTVRGRELMYLILDQLDRGILRELRYSPEPRPYFRDDYAPLRID